MSKNLFEHNINLIITDASISVCDKTDFSSYRTFSMFVHDGIKAKNYSGIERYLIPIVNELAYIMGIPVKEAALYVAKFFKGKKWDKYYKPVMLVKEQFNIFLVP